MDELLDRIQNRRILVVGDCMLDRYIEGGVTRISPEAPVPVVSVQQEFACLGGAANVAAGCAALGCNAELAGVIGADFEGDQFRGLAKRAALNLSRVAVDPLVRTVAKTRILGDRQHQLLRLDQDGDYTCRARASESLTSRLVEDVPQFAAVILADYEKGTLPNPIVRNLIDTCLEAQVPVLVDPKKDDFEVYQCATVITPNLAELQRATQRSLKRIPDIVEAADKLRQQFKFECVLVTLGPDGMCLVDRRGHDWIPAHVRHVSDVAGAGDTVVSVLAACLGASIPITEAARYASLAAGIAVSHPRVFVVGKEELARAQHPCSAKILAEERISELGRRLREQGRRIVFTNGCFDVLHAGHLRYLEEAKSLGDELVVGLNGDASVMRLKGPTRPRIALEHRAALLAGLACVDWIVPFEDDTPLSLVAGLRPDVLVKGGDYSPQQIVGAKIVAAYGGDVVVTSFVDGLSSTAILASERQGLR